MGRYRRKPVEVEASQWFKNGDHPEDGGAGAMLDQATLRSEGEVVRYFRRPGVPGGEKCKYCSKTMLVHGWIDTSEGGHIVCPGDWVITGVKGERYPCKPDVFLLIYDPVVSLPNPEVPLP